MDCAVWLRMNSRTLCVKAMTGTNSQTDFGPKQPEGAPFFCTSQHRVRPGVVAAHVAISAVSTLALLLPSSCSSFCGIVFVLSSCSFLAFVDLRGLSFREAGTSRRPSDQSLKMSEIGCGGSRSRATRHAASASKPVAARGATEATEAWRFRRIARVCRLFGAWLWQT